MTNYNTATLVELSQLTPNHLTRDELESILVRLSYWVALYSCKTGELKAELAVLGNQKDYVRQRCLPPKVKGVTDLDRTRESYTSFEYIEHTDKENNLFKLIAHEEAKLVKAEYLFDSFREIYRRR